MYNLVLGGVGLVSFLSGFREYSRVRADRMRRVRVGRTGELHVAKVLEQTLARLRKSRTVRGEHLNDVMVPYSAKRSFQADHILYGRDCIVLVETKHWSGKLQVRGSGVDVVSRGRLQQYGNPIQQAYRNRERLLASLRAGGHSTPVFSIVVFSNTRSQVSCDERSLPAGVAVTTLDKLDGLLTTLLQGRYTHSGQTGGKAWRFVLRMLGGFYRQWRLHKIHARYVQRNEKMKTRSRGLKRIGFGVVSLAAGLLVQFGALSDGVVLYFQPSGVATHILHRVEHTVTLGLHRTGQGVERTASDEIIEHAVAKPVLPLKTEGVLTKPVAQAPMEADRSQAARRHANPVTLPHSDGGRHDSPSSVVPTKTGTTMGGRHISALTRANCRSSHWFRQKFAAACKRVDERP